MYGLITGLIIGSSFSPSGQDSSGNAGLLAAVPYCTAAALEAAASARGLIRAGKRATYREKILCVKDSVAKEGLLSYAGKRPCASLVCASPAAWLSSTMEETIESAFACASAMTDDQKYIDRAVFFAQSVFLVRCGVPRKQIRQVFTSKLGFRTALKTTSRRRNKNPLTPFFKALTAFFQGSSFEDTIRRAVELGGDMAETAAAAGELAAALYGIPAQMRDEAARRIPDDIRALIQSFESRIEPHPEPEPEEPDLNGMLETAVRQMTKDRSADNIADAVKILVAMGKHDKELYVPVRYTDIPEALPDIASVSSLISGRSKTPDRYGMAFERDRDGKVVYLAFTRSEQTAAIGGCASRAMLVGELFLNVRSDPDCSGFIVNRRDGDLFMTKGLADTLLSYIGCTPRTGMEGAALRKDVREFGRQNVGLFTGNGEFYVPVLPDCKDEEEGSEITYLNHLASCIYMEKHVLIPANPDSLPEALRGLSVIDGRELSDEELDECALRIGCIKDVYSIVAVAAFTNADQFCMGPAVPAVCVPIKRLFNMPSHPFVVLDTWDTGNEVVLDGELQDRLRKIYEDILPDMSHLKCCPVQTDESWPEIRAVIYSANELEKLDAVCVPADFADGRPICGTGRSFFEAAGISGSMTEEAQPGEGSSAWEKDPDILASPCLAPLHVVRTYVPRWADGARMELMQLCAASGMAIVAAAKSGIRRIAFMAVTEDGEYPAPECARYCVEGVKAALAMRKLHERFDLIEWLVPDSYYRELYIKETARCFLS